MLSSEDLAYRGQCRRYADGELAGLVEKYGEINDVPHELRLSLAGAGLFRYLIPRRIRRIGP